MERRYIKAQSENKAVMLFDGFIGNQIISKEFISDLMFLDSLKLDEITIKVNSGGGDVFQGFAILSAIEDAETTIHIDVVGMAASMAFGIVLAGDRRTARNHAMLMSHPASVDQPEDEQDDDTKKLLKDINAAFSRLIKARTNMSKDDIDAIFNGGDTWFTAQEAKDHGIIDEVTPIAKKPAKAESEAIMIEVNKILNKKGTVQEIYATYNELLTPKPNEMKLVKSALKLPESATEEEVVSAIKAVEGKAIVVEGVVITAENHTDLIAKVTELEGELTVANKTATEALVVANKETIDKAAKDGHISDASVPMYVKMAEESNEQFKAVMDSFGISHPGSIDDQIEDKGKPSAKATYPKAENPTFVMEKKETWSHLDWEKNDPEGLVEMKANDPEKEEKMYNDCYRDEAAQ